MASLPLDPHQTLYPSALSDPTSLGVLNPITIVLPTLPLSFYFHGKNEGADEEKEELWGLNGKEEYEQNITLKNSKTSPKHTKAFQLPIFSMSSIQECKETEEQSSCSPMMGNKGGSSSPCSPDSKRINSSQSSEETSFLLNEELPT